LQACRLGADAARRSPPRRLTSPVFGCGPSPSSAGVSNRFCPLRRQIIRNSVERGHETQPNHFDTRDLWPSASRSWKIIPDLETVNKPSPDSFRPQNQRKRAQNPEQRRPQPPDAKRYFYKCSCDRLFTSLVGEQKRGDSESRTGCVPISSLRRPATHLSGQFALRSRCPGARPQLHGRTGVPDASTDTHGSRRLIVSYTDK